MHNHKEPYETYEDSNAWITPLGKCNIIHYDCPTGEEIRQRVTNAINEIVNGDGFEDDCPLCTMMKGQPYNIVYCCTEWCHNCKKANICKNFSPNSRAEEEALNQYNNI